MAQLASKRSVISLYSRAFDLQSHRVRAVLCAKGINAEIIEIQQNNLPEKLLELNPRGTLPMLVDRDLVLHEPNIIVEYLDERFPHPPLLPVYPIARAKCRQIIYSIEQDFYTLVSAIEQETDKGLKASRQKLKDNLLLLAPLFSKKPYFLSDELTLVDCCLAPLLWRLQSLNIELPASSVINTYTKFLFKKPFFKSSLSKHDLELYTLK